jgi:hypothetical protein
MATGTLHPYMVGHVLQSKSVLRIRTSDYTDPNSDPAPTPAPDPATFVSDLQDGNKKLLFCLLLFEATFI